MDENSYEPPKVTNERNRRRTFLAIFAPLSLPAVAVAFCTMCTMNGAVQASPMWSPSWLVAVCILAAAGIFFLGSMIYLAVLYVPLLPPAPYQTLRVGKLRPSQMLKSTREENIEHDQDRGGSN